MNQPQFAHLRVYGGPFGFTIVALDPDGLVFATYEGLGEDQVYDVVVSVSASVFEDSGGQFAVVVDWH